MCVNIVSRNINKELERMLSGFLKGELTREEYIEKLDGLSGSLDRLLKRRIKYGVSSERLLELMKTQTRLRLIYPESMKSEQYKGIKI